MNPPPVLLKTLPQRKKKKKNQDLSTKPSVMPDDEQTATQNLFNVSNLQDSVNQQRKFNTTFDIFRSVDFNEENFQDQNPFLNLIKTSRNEHLNQYHPQSLEFRPNKRFLKGKIDKVCKKNYENVPQPSSAKSKLLKFSKQKMVKKFSQKKSSSFFNELKSNTVFVGKTTNDVRQQNNFQLNHLNSLLKNSGGPNTHRNCIKIRLKNSQLDNERSFSLMKPKLLSINDQLKYQTEKQKPDIKRQSIYKPYLKNQKLERNKKVFSEQANVTNLYTQSVCKEPKNQDYKANKNLQFMNNRILGLDDFKDYPFQSRHSKYRKQRK